MINHTNLIKNNPVSLPKHDYLLFKYSKKQNMTNFPNISQTIFHFWKEFKLKKELNFVIRCDKEATRK